MIALELLPTQAATQTQANLLRICPLSPPGPGQSSSALTAQLQSTLNMRARERRRLGQGDKGLALLSSLRNRNHQRNLKRIFLQFHSYQKSLAGPHECYTAYTHGMLALEGPRDAISFCRWENRSISAFSAGCSRKRTLLLASAVRERKGPWSRLTAEHSGGGVCIQFSQVLPQPGRGSSASL